jgi:hypothetical protein
MEDLKRVLAAIEGMDPSTRMLLSKGYAINPSDPAPRVDKAERLIREALRNGGYVSDDKYRVVKFLAEDLGFSIECSSSKEGLSPAPSPARPQSAPASKRFDMEALKSIRREQFQELGISSEDELVPVRHLMAAPGAIPLYSNRMDPVVEARFQAKPDAFKRAMLFIEKAIAAGGMVAGEDVPAVEKLLAARAEVGRSPHGHGVGSVVSGNDAQSASSASQPGVNRELELDGVPNSAIQAGQVTIESHTSPEHNSVAGLGKGLVKTISDILGSILMILGGLLALPFVVPYFILVVVTCLAVPLTPLTFFLIGPFTLQCVLYLAAATAIGFFAILCGAVVAAPVILLKMAIFREPDAEVSEFDQGWLLFCIGALPYVVWYFGIFRG